MNVANYRRLLSVFVYCGVAVLVIVNGQSTTDDDFERYEISRDTVEALRAELKAELRAEMRAELAKSADRNEALKAKLDESTDAIASLKSQVTSLKNQLDVSQGEIAKLKNKGKDKKKSEYVIVSMS